MARSGGRGARGIPARARRARRELRRRLAWSLYSSRLQSLKRPLIRLIDRLRYERGPLLPPASLRFVGGGFESVGRRWRQRLVELGGLAPDSRVLDMGCGIGRIALPLTGELTRGSYEGFDVVPQGIIWCQEHVTPRFPNFRFQLADVGNPHYNPRGRYRAAEYEFPFPDEEFDLAFATSLFTHMPPLETRRYLTEAARVLRPRGRLVSTYFLLDDVAAELVGAGEAAHPFEHELSDDAGAYRVRDPEAPSSAIAQQQSSVETMLRACGLRLLEPVRYGRWSGRPTEAPEGQDVVVAVRD